MRDHLQGRERPTVDVDSAKVLELAED